jgi:16S rRNA (cytosine967-C5)-methyltransferase
MELLDSGAALDAVSIGGPLDSGRPADNGAGSTAQLWPHVHGTDAMFLALIRKPL